VSTDDLHGVVYPPPRPDLPHVAVLFRNGRVLKAVSVPSVEAGEKAIATLLEAYTMAASMAAKHGGTFFAVSTPDGSKPDS
jgi:hypothetical protein